MSKNQTEEKIDIQKIDIHLSPEGNPPVESLSSENKEAAPKETVSATASIDEPSIEERVQALELELKKKGEDYLRLLAEMQNLQRRHQIDIEKINKYGIEKLAKDLLPVIDTLEKSLAHAKEIAQPEMLKDLQPIQEGVDLTLKLLTDTLAKWGLESIDPNGQPFNPAHHEAMSMVESTEVPNGHVLQVLMSGYRLHDRVLRPAMVTVAKNSSTSSSTNSEHSNQHSTNK